MAHIDAEFVDEGPGSPDEIEEAVEQLGGEKGLKARRTFQRETRNALSTFQNNIFENPNMGKALRRCVLQNVVSALERATAEYVAVINTTEQKVS